MFEHWSSEMWLYGGIGMMAVAAVVMIICIVIFKITGKMLKKKLTEEYGKPIW